MIIYKLVFHKKYSGEKRIKRPGEIKFHFTVDYIDKRFLTNSNISIQFLKQILYKWMRLESYDFPTFIYWLMQFTMVLKYYT